MDKQDIVNRLKNSELKKVSEATGIPYDRMYKWTKGKGNPKTDDLYVLIDYFNGNLEQNPKIDKDVEYYKSLLIEVQQMSLRDKDEIIKSKDEIIRLKGELLNKSLPPNKDIVNDKLSG